MRAIKLNVLRKLALLAFFGLVPAAWGQQTVSIFQDLAPGGQYCFYPVEPTKFVQIYGQSHNVSNGSGATGTTWTVWQGTTEATAHTTEIFSQTSAGLGDIEALSGPTFFISSGWVQVCVSNGESQTIEVNEFEYWE
jgi:hypothetical protein